jgi:hypothetical protein
MNPNPMLDGKDHINVYSRGSTLLGRDLSAFASLDFTHPEYGKFNSLEGFYYYVSTGFKHEEFKTLAGYKVKAIGKTLPKVYIDDDEFYSLIKSAFHQRFEEHKLLKEAFITNKLPMTHYYYYGTRSNPKVISPANDITIEILHDLKIKYLKELANPH